MSLLRTLLTSLSLLALTACAGTDPILEKAAAGGDDAKSTSGEAHTAKGAATSRRGTPKPGSAGDPAPGSPGEPSTPKPVQPKPVQVGSPPPGKGPGVKLTGKVVLPDHKGGTIKVDVFDGDQRAASGGGKRPGVVAMARLDQPGTFEVIVPEGTERVWLGAFADEDLDGKPGPLDPECWYDGNPVDMSQPQEGLELVLVRRAPPPGK